MLESPLSEGNKPGLALVDVGRARNLLVGDGLRQVFEDGITLSTFDLFKLARAVEKARCGGLKRDIRDGLNEENGDDGEELHRGLYHEHMSS